MSELIELVQSIGEGKPPAITGQDGLKALEVVDTTYQPTESGRTVGLCSENYGPAEG